MVVDDHQIVRSGIIALIQENEQLEVCGEANHGKEALEVIQRMSRRPDVVLMDINMPVMDGIHCTEALFRTYQGATKVLALTMVKQSMYIRKMLQAGASGYILKNCDKLELYRAIYAVNAGGTHFSQAVSMEIMNEMTRLRRDESLPEHAMLSKRELEVLRLIVKDMSNKEIADKLHISVRTVESHKQNMMSKTGTNNVAGLVVFAIKNNLAEIN